MGRRGVGENNGGEEVGLTELIAYTHDLKDRKGMLGIGDYQPWWGRGQGEEKERAGVEWGEGGGREGRRGGGYTRRREVL